MLGATMEPNAEPGMWTPVKGHINGSAVALSKFYNPKRDRAHF